MSRSDAGVSAASSAAPPRAPSKEPATVRIESLDQEGRGVGRVGGKVVFVEGALPGETVTYRAYRRKPTFEMGEAESVARESAMRVVPCCPHFGTCGGCSLQHLEAGAQVAAKQRVLEENLARIGKVQPEVILAPIRGPSWGYRYRARLSSRWVEKKGGVLVGFHERRSSYIADMETCLVLPPRIGALIRPLRNLVGSLSRPDRMPQIEVAIGGYADVLVFRILEPLTGQDEEALRAFADAHGVQIYLQPHGPDSAYRFHPVQGPELSYSIPEFDVILPFKPTEFTQVNLAMNRVLVRRAVGLLDPRPGEWVADLFCGLGNFTLPIARRGANVVGFEGSAALVARARENAVRNGLAERTAFVEANLFAATGDWLAGQGRFDKILFDPPRDGAVEAVKALGAEGPWRIVYVSCNPATLARDAGVLVHVKGYRLKAAGIVNMFPHTAHVESVALFER
ncbi:MAG: 23S rRNA (uracil(1939)-C(5))-methyltransferase RlmD [Betaproteobacteria bacterium]|nr:23S rRNA (uracil(1939)-C(5))-methyltransferase RlmD [Betaproteobacteria bacterium]